MMLKNKTGQKNIYKKRKLRFRKWVIVVFMLFFLSMLTFAGFKIYE